MSSLQAEHDAKVKEYDSKLNKQRTEHAAAIEGLKKSLTDDHQSAIAALELQHKAALESGSANAKSTYEKQIKDLSAKHESTTNDLQKRLEEATAAQAALETTHKQKLDSQSKESAAKIGKLEADLKSLTATSEADKKALVASKAELAAMTPKYEVAQKELAGVSKKYEELQGKNAKDEQTLASAQEELSKVKQDVTSMQKMMDALDEESKSKNEVQNKMKAELAAAIKNLEDKTKEISTLEEKHRIELETLSDDHQTEIDALEKDSSFKQKYEDLNAKHEELVKSQTEGSASHAAELDKMKKVEVHVAVLR